MMMQNTHKFVKPVLISIHDEPLSLDLKIPEFGAESKLPPVPAKIIPDSFIVIEEPKLKDFINLQ